MDTAPQNKSILGALSKEEIIIKYKGLLNLAKKAKQAKDELAEENRRLKDNIRKYEEQQETDKSTLSTMQEMLASFTEKKLNLTNQVTELERQRQTDMEALASLSIENESVKRQLQRFSDDNEVLLANLERMEAQLQQVNNIGEEQKDDLILLDEQVSKLKNVERTYEQLLQEKLEMNKALEKLKEKYTYVKEINTEQKQKFNSLKERFIEVHGKLKKLKECKRVLLETQHEYGESVTQWQNQIINASKLLCQQLNNLKTENVQLLQKVGEKSLYYDKVTINRLNQLLKLSEKAFQEHKGLQYENSRLLSNQESSVLRRKAIKCIEIPAVKLHKLDELSLKAIEEHEMLRKKNHQLQNLVDSTNSLKFYAIVQDILLLCDKVKEEYDGKLQEIEQLKEANKKLKAENNQVVHAEAVLSNSQVENTELLRKLQNVEQEKQNLLEELDQLKTKWETEQIVLREKLNVIPHERGQHEDLLCVQQSLAEVQALHKQKEMEYIQLLNEMQELNKALKDRTDLISRQQFNYNELLKDLHDKSEKLKLIEKSLDTKEIEMQQKQAKLEALTLEVEKARQKVDHLESACSLNAEKAHILSTEVEKLRSINTFKPANNNTEDQRNVELTTCVEQYQLNEDQQLNIDLKQKSQQLTDQLTAAQQQVEALHRKYMEAQKSVEVLKTENQKLQNARNQTNVLNLEIEAAEKSLSEVTAKLTARTNKLSHLEEVLATQEANNKQLRQEVELLEAAKNAEVKHSMELKEQIDHLQQTLRDVVHAKQQAFDKNQSYKIEIENLQSELKDAHVEWTKTSSQHEETVTTLKTENELLKHQLNITQEKLRSVEYRLKAAERNTEALRTEFSDYKVKAQNVLKRNQTRDLTSEKDFEEEIVALKHLEEQHKRIIEGLTNKLASAEKQKELIQDDNEHSKKRIKELSQTIEDLHILNESLTQEIQQHVQQQHEALKQHRIQINTIDEAHKEQLQNLQQSCEKQLEQLRTELIAQRRLPPVVRASLPNQSPASINKTDFTLMEREDAEGSEEDLATSRKISNASTNNKRLQSHDYMTLDELLNTSINDIHTETLIMRNVEDSDHVNTSTLNRLHAELNNTKERLQKQEIRVRHLTALLAENEQDLAKLTQMNDMLKEELRRQERSEEREQHMHNSEYLKNVLIKFLTLNQGDEKVRLVPVLNTILKLNRTETEILNCAAKGQRVNTESSQRNTGWGNFLTSWSTNNHTYKN